MKQSHYLIILSSLLIFGCKENLNSSVDDSKTTNKDRYEDGTYCAEVDYHNSATGTNSTYTLEVEIENNELTVIHWPNKGWLNISPFTSPHIRDGKESFICNEGIDYTVRITGSEGDCILDSHTKNPDDLICDKEESAKYVAD